MAFGKTITLFSEFNGRLVDGSGVPQADIQVVRSWRRNPEDAPTVDATVTDADGSFHFPAVTTTSFMASFLPGTPVIAQEISAQGPNGDVMLWKTVKTNFGDNGELDGRPLNLECRLDAEPDGEGPAWGTCRELESN